MLLFQKASESYLNLSNPAKGLAQLADLGFSNASANPGWYYDRNSGTFKQAAANAIRFSGCGLSYGLLSEDGQTNLCLYSSENNAAWADLGTAPTRASATSCIDGKTAIKITAANNASGIRQTVSTFTGSDETFSVIVEQGTAAACDISYFDATAASPISRIRLTFATGAISTIVAGATKSFAYKIANTGPNGGALWMLALTDTGTGGNSRTVRFFADPAGSTGYTYFHHGQLVASPYCSSPIVTTSGSVQRDTDTILSTSFIPGYTSAATIYAEAEVISSRDDVGQYFFGTTNGAQTEALLLTFSSGSADPSALVVIGGVPNAVSSGAAATTHGIYKCAISHTNGHTLAAQGGTVGADGTVAGFPSAADYSIIGNLGNKIRSIKIFDSVAYGSTELARLTT